MPGRHHPGIPLLPAALVGREREIATAHRTLETSGARLLTLTGPPGVGKTSLALELATVRADRHRHGGQFVDLSPLGSADLVAPTIADALAVGGGGRRPAGRLIRFLQNQDLLLVLDNFEHVMDAAPLVADLLAACPRLTVLVTSRTPLRLRWEHELPVTPLGLPDLATASEPAELARAPAVTLFVERAHAVLPGFGLDDQHARLIAEICIRLDGLPLAIELAAARIRLLSPVEMHARLVGAGTTGPDQGRADGRRTSALHLLADGPRDLPARQQTLRNAIAWSYNLLDEPEQRAFRQLAVFVGGCTLEGAEALVSAAMRDADGTARTPDASPDALPLVSALVEQNLVRREQTNYGEPRLRMLETVREFAYGQLVALGELPRAEREHAAYLVTLAERAEPALAGPEQANWLDRLDLERDNVRRAASRAVGRGDVETVVRLDAALIRYWRSHADELSVRERVAGILALATTAPPTLSTVKALAGAGDLARSLGEYETAQALFERCLQIARDVGDRDGIASALWGLCRFSGHRGRYQAARQYGEESVTLYEETGNLVGLAAALCDLGMILYFERRQAEARATLERGLEIARQIGDRDRVSELVYSLALTYHVAGDFGTARRHYDECLTICRELGSRTITGSALGNLGNLLTLDGDLEGARLMLHESLTLSRGAGDRRRLAFTLSSVAGLAAATEAPERALRLDAAASAATRQMGARLASAMRAVHDAQLEPARHALGGERAATAEAEGASVPLDEAVDEALAWLASPSSPVKAVDREDDGQKRQLPHSITEPGGSRPHASPAGALTRREHDVATLIGRGLSNREIAAELVLTEATAANYVQRVMNRLGLRRRSQVAAWAVEHGLTG